MTIVTISNISVGYGCPQIPAFLRFLMKHWNAEGIILEPDQPQRPPVRDAFPDITVQRMMTRDKPFGNQWNIEYVLMCKTEIERIRPEVIVVFDPIGLPVLEKLRYKPRYVIYYCLEMPEHYQSFKTVNEELHRKITSYADLILFAEENRKQRFIQHYNCSLPSAVVYNCVDTDRAGQPEPHRNGRLLYQGTIDNKLTFADYYRYNETQMFPIDMFGMIEGNDRVTLSEQFAYLHSNVRYLGYVTSKALAAIRRKYCFGIVSWNPIQDNFLYAAPNKFFEYVQDGVVPIAAPHPQCKHLIEKYHCGILMRDWSYNAFIQAVSHAMSILNTPRYDELVKKCMLAWERELNWASQMEKVKKYLPETV